MKFYYFILNYFYKIINENSNINLKNYQRYDKK